MTSAWLVEQSLTVRTFSHQCVWLMGVHVPQCIRCLRYLDATEDTGQHVETYLVARRASSWNQDYSSRSCISMPEILSRVCSPGTPESTAGCAQVSSLSPPVSASSKYNGAYLCLRSDICSSCVCNVTSPNMAGVCCRGDYTVFCSTVYRRYST